LVGQFRLELSVNLAGIRSYHLKFSEDTTKLEKTWIKDASVIKLSNGTYLMAYVSEIP
jgi:hypothetical protein